MTTAETLRLRDPRVIAVAAITLLAFATFLYNCRAASTPAPAGVDQNNEQILRDAASRLLIAIKAGAKPAKGSELPPLNASTPANPNDAFGRELIVELTPAAGKNVSFVIRSAGKDGQPGTDDDLRAESTIIDQNGFTLGVVVVSVGK